MSKRQPFSTPILESRKSSIKKEDLRKLRKEVCLFDFWYTSLKESYEAKAVMKTGGVLLDRGSKMSYLFWTF